MQTDAMAKGKSSDSGVLTEHVLTYSIVLGLIIGSVIAWQFGSLKNAILWTWMNSTMHWMTDYITSRQTSRLWREQRVHAFFVVIGLDQFVHVTTLVATAGWLLR
jgi:membrane-bound metal-dependent hydrolase YbcI (DUF457 family)